MFYSNPTENCFFKKLYFRIKTDVESKVTTNNTQIRTNKVK